MRISEVSKFCFSLLSFSKLLLPFFLFQVIFIYAMRLSIGSVVVVLVASKGSVWVCKFFCWKYYPTKEDGDFLQNRRPELA